MHFRNATERLRVENAIPDHSYPSSALGYEHAAVRKESQAPRMLQTFGHDDNTNFVLFGCVDNERAGSKTNMRYTDGWLLLLRRNGRGHCDYDQQNEPNCRAMNPLRHEKSSGERPYHV